MAGFAETLRLLIEHNLPLQDAVRLAAAATCPPKMQKGAERIAAAIERGEPLGGTVEHVPGFSPMLEWLLRSGHDRGTLSSALAHAADNYHRRAVRLSNTAQLYMAPLLTLVIGGSVTAAYVLLVFGTWMSMIRTVISW